ncbi:IS1182 family transposase [Candidatus Zixiibacteriota bacterium]
MNRNGEGDDSMILRAEDPNQMFFTSRAELVRREDLVRTVDEVVNQLDLAALYACWREGGRGFYDPAMLLKLLFFGYCDGERSSRQLAKRIKYDIRYQYFAGTRRPSYRTLCRFRTINVDLLARYFAQMVSICASLGLLDPSLLAIDGTKIKASAARRRTMRRKDLARLIKKYRALLSEDAARDLAEYADEGEEDEEDGHGDDSSAKPISDQELQKRICQALGRLAGGEREVNLTDEDARLMKTSDGGIRPAFNSQIAVERNQFIVAVDVGNNADDAAHFQPLVRQSQQHLNRKLGKVLADGGYYSGHNLKYIIDAGLEAYVPTGKADPGLGGRFGREDFVYDEMNDRYLCPAGEQLPYKSSQWRHGLARKIYRCSRSKCRRCQLRSACTTGKRRELWISEVWKYEREMKEKLRSTNGRAVYRRRKVLVEPVFGNLKFNLGFGRFVVRGLRKVKGEFLLMCIAHNLKKMSHLRNRWQQVPGAKTTTVPRARSLFRRILPRIRILSAPYQHLGLKCKSAY